MAYKKQGVRKGDVIKGRYEILQLIGEGGMSRVFLASDRQLTNKQWAVKEVDRNATDPAGRPIEQSLANEAEILSKLDHPGIVDIVDIDKTDEFIYVVMDHVEGQSLDKVVHQQGAQREEDVQKWMLQICDAVSYLHNQDPPVIYRDMKPNNIMLRPDGYVKLIDLGVAREYKDEALKDTVAFGTTGYAAPEQYGKAQTDARTDVYGMGATMWHLLSGGAPPVEFPLPNIHTVNSLIGEGFANIIEKCTMLERGLRYQTCDELAADLEIYQELTHEYRAEQKRKVFSFAITGGLAVMLALVGCGLLAFHDAEITRNYDYQLGLGTDLAKTDPEAAEQAYLSAIGYDPDNVDAYLGLLDLYAQPPLSDQGGAASFDEDESGKFNSVYRANVEALRASDRWGELSYQIGYTYWYWYDYGADNGDNQSTRIKASAEYFANAVEYAESHANAELGFDVDRARTYNGIAQFTSNISMAIDTADDDNELYMGYWQNLNELVALVSEAELRDAMKLDAYALAAGAMETYMDDFSAAGVSQKEATDLYGRVRVGLASLQFDEGSNSYERYEDVVWRMAQPNSSSASLSSDGRVGEVLRKIQTVYRSSGNE